MEIKNDNKDLKKFVYAIRITKNERDLLKKNLEIKLELDKIVRDYLKIYL